MELSNNQDPIQDADRIAEIARLGLNQDYVDEVLNAYVTEVSEAFDLPIGLVSIVLDDVQKFSASHGLTGWLEETQGSPVEWSFCANSVKTGKPFVVEDAEQNPITKDNPLVNMDNVKCYAGVPLVTKNGYILGNFCVLGHERRSFSQDDLDLLRKYAAKVILRLEELAAEKD